MAPRSRDRSVDPWSEEWQDEVSRERLVGVTLAVVGIVAALLIVGFLTLAWLAMHFGNGESKPVDTGAGSSITSLVWSGGAH